jgi:hypothetical protein
MGAPNWRSALEQRILAGESTKVLCREPGIPADHLDRGCQQLRLGGAEGLRKAGRPRKQARAGLDRLAKTGRTKALDPARNSYALTSNAFFKCALDIFPAWSVTDLAANNDAEAGKFSP